MRSSEADEIEARLACARKLEEDLDARLALVIARQQERQGVIKDFEAERREAIATGKHGRASAAASGSPQPPISDAAGDDESSKDCPGQVEPSFDSSEVDRLDCVAKCLFKTHGKDAVIKIINGLRETFSVKYYADGPPGHRWGRFSQNPGGDRGWQLCGGGRFVGDDCSRDSRV